MPPPRRRRTPGPYAKQVLGVRLRTGPTPPAEPPKLTPRVVRLLEAIGAHDVKAGQHGYQGQWRWERTTVTAQVEKLLRCGWAHPVGAHLELTEAGAEALQRAKAAGAP